MAPLPDSIDDSYLFMPDTSCHFSQVLSCNPLSSLDLFTLGFTSPIFFLFVFYPFWLQAFNYFPANPSHEFPHPMVSSALYYPLKPFGHLKLLPRVRTFVTTRALKVKDVLLNNRLAFFHPFLFFSLSFSTWSLYSRIIVFISLIFISEFLLE